MSKDLNKEYTDMIQSELPDLWDRISASLPEKEVGPAPRKKTKIYRFGILAAACLCVAVLIPVIVMNGKQKNSSSAAMQEYATAAAEEEMQEREMITAGANMADEAKSMAKTGNGIAAAGEAKGAESENAAGIAEEPVIAAAAPAAEEAALDAAWETATEEAAEEIVYEMDQNSPDEVFLTDVQIRITEELTQEDLKGFWLAEILNNTGYLTKGDEVFIKADEDSPEEFAEGITFGTYTVSLQEAESEEGDTYYLLR